MTVAEILDSPSMPDLPFASPVPQIPVHAITEVDTTDGVRYTQACGHRTWWSGPPERTPRVGQLHGCIACWTELVGAESLAHAVPVAMPTYADPVTPVDLLANFNPMRRWLASKEPTEEVGLGEALRACPIANFLAESGVDQPLVTPHAIQWWAEQHLSCEPLPDWAVRFVALVDQQPRASIRASLAMTLLCEAVRESIGR